jgi:hypothetical protein
MKVKDIIRRVQIQFGDEVQAQISKQTIVDYINDACLEIVTNNRTNEGILKGITPIVAGKSQYDLPADLLNLRGVRVNGRVVAAVTYEQLVATQAIDDTANLPVGQSECYFLHDGKLNLFPVPEEALGTLDIMYVKSPDLITVGMLELEPDVPKQYHLRIVEYCIAQAAELDDNLGQYQLKMNQFNANLQSLRQNGEQPERDDFYPFITYTSEGAY